MPEYGSLSFVRVRFPLSPYMYSTVSYHPYNFALEYDALVVQFRSNFCFVESLATQSARHICATLSVCQRPRARIWTLSSHALLSTTTTSSSEYSFAIVSGTNKSVADPLLTKPFADTFLIQPINSELVVTRSERSCFHWYSIGGLLGESHSTTYCAYSLL